MKNLPTDLQIALASKKALEEKAFDHVTKITNQLLTDSKVFIGLTTSFLGMQLHMMPSQLGELAKRMQSDPAVVDMGKAISKSLAMGLMIGRHLPKATSEEESSETPELDLKETLNNALQLVIARIKEGKMDGSILSPAEQADNDSDESEGNFGGGWK